MMVTGQIFEEAAGKAMAGILAPIRINLSPAATVILLVGELITLGRRVVWLCPIRVKAAAISVKIEFQVAEAMICPGAAL